MKWIPKQGEEVYAWDEWSDSRYKRIFIAEVKGNTFPYLCVNYEDEHSYKDGNAFDTDCFQNIGQVSQVVVTMSEIAEMMDCHVEELIIEP
jgi:hypothetical protein